MGPLRPAHQEPAHRRPIRSRHGRLFRRPPQHRQRMDARPHQPRHPHPTTVGIAHRRPLRMAAPRRPATTRRWWSEPPGGVEPPTYSLLAQENAPNHRTIPAVESSPPAAFAARQLKENGSNSHILARTPKVAANNSTYGLFGGRDHRGDFGLAGDVENVAASAVVVGADRGRTHIHRGQDVPLVRDTTRVGVGGAGGELVGAR